ncbi:SPOSA6832_02670 [Sporobolomyces salmonicolor]|uniref:SPOSA6832_02670-mRNA-1:cds n=1 Tax=Sporidiobolus salmonicolor TaxID=5005 RepID=A0A0D6ELX6_SPOSA|nr:SPOSA6832_02670 [Sporobolomyces salmonicolor]
MALPSAKLKSDAIRAQLNLKNLQRHDPLITEIVTSASYASVYENTGEDWVKTGVEGPMFLFSRSQAPLYGFFVLNRQGLEYVQEFLTPESEVKVGGEFILFESGEDVAGWSFACGSFRPGRPVFSWPKSEAGTSTEQACATLITDKATGIWVFEEKERIDLCKRMEQLRLAARAAAAAATSTPSLPAAPAPSLPIGQSISLDALFAASSPVPAAASLPLSPSAHPQRPAPGNPLDALFAAARNSPGAQPPAPPAPPQSVQQIPRTLEQLFAAASPTPQAAVLPLQMTQPTAQAQTPGQAKGLSLLDSIFASAANGGAPFPVSPQPQRQLQPQTFSSPKPAARAPAPTSPSQPPGDARALLAMLGHPLAQPGNTATASASASVSETPESAIKSLIGAQAPVPSSSSSTTTTTHPAPFKMDGPPIGALSGSGSPSVAEKVVQKEEQQEKETEKQMRPLFAPPLLSHDVFERLPMPAGVMGAKGKAAASATPTKPPQANGLASPSLASLPSTAVASPSVPGPATNGSPAPAPAPAPLLLSKAELVNLVDEAAATAIDSAGGEGEKDGPMSQEEFMKRVKEVLLLYGRYLERYEENEA